MGRMLSFKRGCFQVHRGYLLLGAHAWLPFFLFQRVCLRRCWVSSFGGIFSPGAISGNLHPSAVQRRTDFLSSPLGETLLAWLLVALDYCGLSFGLLVGLLVWVVDPICAPCLGHSMSGSLVFSSCLPLFGQRV